MTGLRVPRLLAEHLASDPDPARLRWLDQLPGVIAGLCGRWGLELGDPFEPGGQCSWVAPARTTSGGPLVLKVGWSHPEATHEGAALEFWDGNGAVLMHAHEVIGDSIALLLERCVPGTTLSESAAEPDQDTVLCGLLPRLWCEPPAGNEFPSLEAMCAAWADEYEQNPDRQPLDPGLERAGLELFRGLPATAGRRVLLATDLHAQNVLAAQREPWLAIDPKPHIGDPAYDPLQHMINCGRLRADPAGLGRRIAGLLDLDAERLLLWLFARCVQGSPVRPDLADVAVRLAP